jgi:hypothetical protein
MIERNGFLSLKDQLIIQLVQHFEERHIFAHVLNLVVDKTTLVSGVLLSPNS